MQELQESDIPTKSSLQSAAVTLDLETNSLNWRTGKIHLNGYRINGTGDVLYANPRSLDRDLKELLAEPSTVLRGHNIKFDALFLANAGYSINCQLEDTRVMAYTCWPSEPSHGLKDLIERKLGKRPQDLNELTFKVLKREAYGFRMYEDEYCDFISEKGIVTWARKDKLMEYHKEDIYNVDRIRALMIPPKWYWNVEYPLTKILFEAEFYGCPLDLPHLELMKFEYDNKVEKLLRTLQNGNEEFNPNSTDQVSKRLESLGHDLSKICDKTDTGKFSVDKQALKTLAWKGDTFATTLLEYRRLSKLLSTYINPFISGARADGRLHGSINQAGSENLFGDSKQGTNTGRLSSNNPNLQNIPARTQEGKEVRKAFIATPGWLMFNSDLKQIEPRLVAHFSQSSKLIEAYANGKDTHGMFASDIFNKTVEQLSKTERFIGKTSWLATTYGCSNRKLLNICEIFSDEELTLDLKGYERAFEDFKLNCFGRFKCRPDYPNCKACLRKAYGEDAESIASKWAFFRNVQDSFKAKNPEIMAWVQEAKDRARTLGYITTLGGRRIPLPDIQLPNTDENRGLIAKAERKAVNTPIQGSSADIMKLILISMRKNLADNGRIFATVHDEVLGEVRAESYFNIVVDCMENTVKLNNVRIDSDSKLVKNWSEK